MSRSGRRFRDPHTLDARRRKAGPIGRGLRHVREELERDELDNELQNMWHDEYELQAIKEPENDDVTLR